MKKLILLVIILVLMPSIACCQGIEYDKMSIEDLIAIRNEIDKEISLRFVTNEIFMTGVYEVGTDIVPGEYIITFIEARPGYDLGWIRIYASYDKFIDSSVLRSFNPMFANESIHFPLREDQILSIGDGTYLVRLLDNKE